MKEYIEKLQANPNVSKLVEWGKLLGITSTSQFLVQGIGFISGIIVIRILSIEEYAFYTLANTILATMTALADGGISIGVFSQSAKVWQNKSKLGSVITTGLQLRKKFAVWSFIISTPILFYLLLQHDASWLMVILITISLIPAFYAELSSAIYVIVPKLHQEIPAIQKNDVQVGIGRFFLTSIFIFIFPFTFIAILANGLARVYGNFQLKKIAESFISKQKSKKKVRKKLLNTVKKMLPHTIYYCISGQIMLWIISFFGDTITLAELGALTRIAVVIASISAISRMLFIPRFARLKKNKKKLAKFYRQIIFIILIIIFVLIFSGYIFSNQILWVLGDNYSGLQIELVLILIGGGINLLSGTSFELNISRDWIINPFILISLSILSMIIGALIFDISVLIGILEFNILIGFIQFIANISYGYYRLKKVNSIPV